MWKFTTATIPSSSWVSSSTACKANKEFIYCFVMSMQVLFTQSVSHMHWNCMKTVQKVFSEVYFCHCVYQKRKTRENHCEMQL